MNILFKRHLFYIFLFFSTYSFSQQNLTVEKIFDLVENSYKNVAKYSYKVNYSFYVNEKSTKASESYEGLVLKFNSIKYQKINDVEFVDFGDKNVMLNHKEKLIQVSKIENTNSPVLIKTYLNMFPVHKLVEEKSQFVCTLSSGKINQTNIDRIIFFIDKKTYSIKKQTFIYLGVNESTNKNTINNPRLEIVFIPRKINDIGDLELVKKSNYYTIQSNNIVTSNKYKTYKLIVY